MPPTTRATWQASRQAGGRADRQAGGRTCNQVHMRAGGQAGRCAGEMWAKKVKGVGSSMDRKEDGDARTVARVTVNELKGGMSGILSISEGRHKQE